MSGHPTSGVDAGTTSSQIHLSSLAELSLNANSDAVQEVLDGRLGDPAQQSPIPYRPKPTEGWPITCADRQLRAFVPERCYLEASL